ncbi:MAG: 3-keto-disaccharide hydrolase, partial [Segetibacter sp.]
MYKILVFVLAVVIAHGCSSVQKSSMKMQDNMLSDQEKKQGWNLLFDGKTMNGWHSYGYNSVGKAWDIEDGALHLDVKNKKDWPANESKDILTDEEFSDFDFKADWK